MGVKWNTCLWVGSPEERAPLRAAVQGLGDEGDCTPLGHEPADLKTPVGIEIIDDPIVVLHRGQWVDDVGQMPGPISTGARLPQIPDHLPRGHDQRGQQGARAMADILMRAFFWLPRLDRLGGVAALQHLHAGLCIGADDHALLVVVTEGMAIELADRTRLGLEVWIVAVEPVHAPMRLEVGLLQHAPNAGATHGLQPMLQERRDQIIETPSGGGTMIRGRFLGRHRQHIDPFRGGKSAAGDPSAAHPAGR